MPSGAEMLGRELSGPLPDEFAKLTDDQLRDLATMLSRTRARQLAALEAATEESLKNLPFVLRGPVRIIVESGG